MLTPLHVIFYFFAFIAVVSSTVVISARNPVHNVLALVLTFFAMAVIWMLLHAEFLSLILILVYVGAVMTLFLFVVMMLNIDKAKQKIHWTRYVPFAMIVAILVTGLTIIGLSPASSFGLLNMPAPQPEPAGYSNIQQLGEVLYTQYAYPFEIAGVILLAAIIAAITLAYRGPVRRRVQHPSKQIAVQPEDRVRLIKMPPVRGSKGTSE